MSEPITASASAAPAEGTPRDARRLALRVGITIILLAVVTWKLDLGALTARLTTLDAGWTALAFVAVFAAVALSAWKWGLILRRRGRPLGYARLLRHYFVGLFFNNVLPTTVGGDAVRAWETSKDTGELPEAVGSVVTERLIAGVALGFTALLGLPFVAVDARLAALVAIFLAVDLGLVALFLVPRVAEGIVASLVPARLRGVHETIAHIVAVVRATLLDRGLFARVFLYSIAFQLLVAMVNVCIFRALGMPVGLAACVIYTPMIFTVTMLPVSLSGLGVREAAYWYFFAQAGVPQADAVAASLTFFVIVGFASLPGAALFALARRCATCNPAPSERLAAEKCS